MVTKQKILEITDDLDYAYEKGKNLELCVNVLNDRYIIFSDHHRGNAGGNDDYRNCNDTYKKALRYYLDNNYKLILLGDIEELWENFNFKNIYDEYKDTYELENKFLAKGTANTPFYIRCFGNHDYRFAFEEHVNSDLRGTAKLEGVVVYEGIKMNLMDNHGYISQIYLTHGHQGHYPRDKDTAKSLFVAAFGAFQSITKIPSNKSIMEEPPILKGMRKSTNTGYLKWAYRKKKIVIFGHTHEAVFMSKSIFNGEPISAYEKDGTKINTLNAFNTGCCSFIDGNITGIEISNNHIRLVKWTANPEELSPVTVINKNDELCEIELKNLVKNI